MAKRKNPIMHRPPHNGLPKWVKETAATRGYTDATNSLSLIVTQTDIDTAFDCAAHGDGAHCVMAQAGQRLGAKSVYFYRTTAWVDFGAGPIQRYMTTDSIYKNIIDPFDKGDREALKAGHYPLTPPSPSKSLTGRRESEKKGRSNRKNPSSNRKKQALAHTDRVVMASQVE